MWPFRKQKTEESMAKQPAKKTAEKSDFEAAVQRQKAAVEKLQRSFDRIRPFDEMAEVLSGASTGKKTS